MPYISNITALPAETTAEAGVAGGPLPQQILGDKYEYWADDTVGLFYVKIPTSVYSNQNVYIRLKDGQNQTIEEVITPYATTTNRFSFKLDVASLHEDDFSLNVSLLSLGVEGEGVLTFGGSAVCVANGLKFSFSKNSAKQLETAAFPVGGITLELQDPTVVISGTISLPTHGFLPIPKNSLPATFALGLYEDNVRIPAQFETIQTWSAAGKPKFMHVHFIGKYDNGVPRTYVVKQESLPDSPPSTNLSVVENSSTITIDNDTIKIIVSKTDYCGIQQMWYDSTGMGNYGSPILNSTSGGHMCVGEYRTWNPMYDPATVVEVEESGPIKVTIRVEGDFQDNYTNTNSPTTNPNRIARSINRIIVYADTPRVVFQTVCRTKSTFMNNGFSNNTILPAGGACREIHDLKFHLPFSNITNYSIGVDGSTISDAVPTYVPSSVTNNLLKDLVAFWPMEETFGIRFDAVGNHHLKTTLDTSPVASTSGLIGTAASFNYTTASNWLRIMEDDTVFDVGGSDNFSISVWVKLTVKNTNPMFVSKWEQNNYDRRGYWLGYWSATDKFRFSLSNGAATFTAETNNGATIQTGQWYHVVGTYDGNTKQLKIVVNNGSPVTATLTGNLLHVNSPFIVGTNNNQGQPHDANTTYGFSGAMDMLGFWRRTLSSQDIADLYNVGSGSTYPFGLTPTTPVPNNTVIYMHQYKHDALRLLGAAESHDPDTLEKSDSWAEATTSNNVRISLLGKDLWKRYPKELEISQNGITYHTWPTNGMLAFSIEEQINPLNINQNLNWQTGKTLSPRMPQEFVAMGQVGPGYICTVNPTTDLVTTNQPHNWSTGQTIQFMRGNVQAVLPVSTPQIVSNNFIYTGTGGWFASNVNTGFGTGGLNDFYYIRVNDSTSFKVFGTLTDAQNNTNAINFTSAESGTLMVGTTTYQTSLIVSENSLPGAYRAGMHGVNLYDEFAIVLSPTSSGFDTADWQELFRQKPIAVPVATYRNIPNSFGDVAVKGAYFTEFEDWLENHMIGYHNFDRIRGYGMFNHGDGHHEWLLTSYGTPTSVPRASLSRNWLTSHYNTVEQLWMMVYHSCTEPILSLARSVSDHYGMIDTGRYDETATKAFGMAHGKACIHWAGGTSTWEHFGDAESYLYRWLIDADLWSKDNYEALHSATFEKGTYPFMDMAADIQQFTYVLESQCHWREYVGSVKKVISMYEHTQDTRLLPYIYSVGRSALGNNLNSTMLTGPIWHPQWLTKYYELTHDPDYEGETGYITTGVTGPAAVWAFSPNTNVGVSNSGISSASLGVAAYKFTSDDTYLRAHFALMQKKIREIAYLPGNDLYNHFGLVPGVLGNAYFPLIWPEFLKQLNVAGITAFDAPETYEDYWGSSFSGSSSYTGDKQRALTVFVLKEVDAPWALNMKIYPPGPGGSNDALGLMVYPKVLGSNPTLNIGSTTDGTLFFDLGVSNVGLFRAERREGSPLTMSINTSTNVVTTSLNNWKTGQFIKIEPIFTGSPSDQYVSAVTMPLSTPQVELHTDYYVRAITSSTFTLHPTASDAWNNTNVIDFLTTGANVGAMCRGYQVSKPHGEVRSEANFHLNSDGNTGLYVVYIGGNNGVVHPITNFPECSVIHRYGTVNFMVGRYSRGYIEPIQSYPIDLTFYPLDDEYPVNVKITDLHGDIVIDQTILINVVNSVTVTIQAGNTIHPTPWKLDVNCVRAFEMRPVPVNGETDEKLFLYGTNLHHIQRIKGVLKYKQTYVMGGGLTASGDAIIT